MGYSLLLGSGGCPPRRRANQLTGLRRSGRRNDGAKYGADAHITPNAAESKDVWRILSAYREIAGIKPNGSLLCNPLDHAVICGVNFFGDLGSELFATAAPR